MPVLVGCLAGVLTLVRLWPRGFRVVYYEDGPLLLEGWRTQGLGCLVESHGGYLHTVPRLLALPGALLPLRWWSAYVPVADAVAVAALAAFVLVAAARLTGALFSATMAALSMALVPGLGSSTLGSLSHLQFLLIVATMWALLSPTPGGTAIAAATGLSSPIAVLVLPAVLVGRDRRPALGLALGSMANLAVVHSIGHDDRLPDQRPAGMPDVGLLAARFFADVAGPGDSLLGFALGVSVAALLGVLVVRARLRAAAAVVCAIMIVFFVATALLNGQTFSRYTSCCAMMLWAAVAILSAGAPLGRLAIPLVLATALVGFWAAPSRVGGPSWPDGVATFDRSCRPIAINGFRPYDVRLPCGSR